MNKFISEDVLKKHKDYVSYSDADTDYERGFSDGVLKLLALLENNLVEIGWEDVTDKNMPEEGLVVIGRYKYKTAEGYKWSKPDAWHRELDLFETGYIWYSACDTHAPIPDQILILPKED